MRPRLAFLPLVKPRRFWWHGGAEEDPMGMWHYMDGGMAFGMVIWWLLGVLLIAALIVALWRLAAPTQFRAGLPEEPSSARRLLDERFARGEIDEAEYRKRRQVLSE